ncbi:hypothetical protein AJ80_06867 [Polytolypa hystricis UAMH7299]|uniref:VWFA domain-containing protein n=1 Tax=Polytolypa hystricis (strain UAMH7299) TaxID=1447883 RepID=A0A2B7XTX4_POLH7|nr:hypothetical protein AJ80_06867 [Polytolypa hystricis UAMH7299]
MGFFSSSKSKSKSKSSSLHPEEAIDSKRHFFSFQGGSKSPSRRNSDYMATSAYEPAFSAQSDMDLPPAYTPSPYVAPAPKAPIGESEDTPYAFLDQFDTIFLIDDSYSMGDNMSPGRWAETSRALQAITPICTAHDPDGIDIYFLNHLNPRASHGSAGGYMRVKRPADVHEIFSSITPRNGTPTGKRLSDILDPYLNRVEKAASADLSVRPLNIIVITDGCASDPVGGAIKRFAKKLDKIDALPWQVGIQFFQVGNDEEAAKQLRGLDDDLGKDEGCRDIVDTVPWSSGRRGGLTADGIMKVVLGAIHKKYDGLTVTGQRERN